MDLKSIFLTTAVFLLISCSFSQEPEQSNQEERDPTILSAPEAGDFTMVVLPDSQAYMAYPSKNDMFKAQTDWIIANRDAENIVFVIHVGDIIGSNSVEGVSEIHWEYASGCMEDLAEAGISYGTVPGNHDYGSGERNTAMYNDYFPLSSFQRMTTYGGAYETGSVDNTWHEFQAGGVSFLILLLEFGPRDEVLTWANTVAENHPEHAVIAATHGYLDYDDHVLARGDNHDPTNGFGLADGNSGTEMWDKLFSLQENMLAVVCGHTGTNSDGAGYLQSANTAGEPVYQLLGNYQNFSFSDSGYVRIMRFCPDSREIRIATYSPSLDQYKTDPDNNFIIGNVRFF